MKYKISKGKHGLLCIDEDYSPLSENQLDYSWQHIEIKFDGTVYLWQAYNEPFCKKYGFHERDDNAQFMQFDLSSMMELMINIIPIAQHFFGESWDGQTDI